MEERKLNFNAPLLSVRRYSTTAVASSDGENGKMVENSVSNRRYSIPFYRTDLNLEQVTEPAAVPFMWEQIPGRPKDGGPELQHSDESPVTPRLPPLRALDITKYPLAKESDDLPRVVSCSLNENMSILDSSNEANDWKQQLDIDNDDDVYSDALDTLSPTDSCSINCSLSGLSGSDGQVVKRSGTFSTDPQTRDFMMRRFLPAAKAMALEPPQYASRKQPVAIEQPRQVIKVVSEDRRPLVNKSIFIPHYGEDVEEEEEETEDEVDEYDDSGNLSGKACGLLPRLCLNKSLCLLNPIPGLKVRTHSSASSSSDVRNSGKAAYTESRSQTVKKSQHAWDAVYKHQPESGVQSPKLMGIENKMTCGSNRFACLSDQQMASRSSPYRRGISPYRNERPQSPFRGGGFLGVPKEAENVRANKLNPYNRAGSKSQELFPHHTFKKGLGSLSPAVEKTLYVDTVNFSKISDTKGQMGSVGKNFQTSMESEGIERTVTVDTAEDENRSETKVSGSIEASRSSYSEKILHPEGQGDMEQCLGLDGELNQECKSLVCTNVTAETLNSSCEHKSEVDDLGYINSCSEQSPLPLPLPKKPTESWLWRTLPSVSSRNSFSNPNGGTRFNPKKQDPKTPLTNTKWETIVKTSYAHHDHIRYSEELTSHFSQQSKT